MVTLRSPGWRKQDKKNACQVNSSREQEARNERKSLLMIYGQPIHFSPGKIGSVTMPSLSIPAFLAASITSITTP